MVTLPFENFNLPLHLYHLPDEININRIPRTSTPASIVWIRDWQRSARCSATYWEERLLIKDPLCILFCWYLYQLTIAESMNSEWSDCCCWIHIENILNDTKCILFRLNFSSVNLVLGLATLFRILQKSIKPSVAFFFWWPHHTYAQLFYDQGGSSLSTNVVSQMFAVLKIVYDC